MSDTLPASWSCKAGVRVRFGHGHVDIKPSGIRCKAPDKNPLSPRGLPKQKEW